MICNLVSFDSSNKLCTAKSRQHILDKWTLISTWFHYFLFHFGSARERQSTRGIEKRDNLSGVMAGSPLDFQITQ